MSLLVENLLVMGGQIDVAQNRAESQKRALPGQVRSAGVLPRGRGLPRSDYRVLGSYAAVYVLGGRGRFEDVHGCSCPLLAGDLMLLFPEIPHFYGPPPGEEWSEAFVLFDGPVFDLWRQSGLLDPTQPVRRLLPADVWGTRWSEFAAGPRPDTAARKAMELCRLLSLLTEALAPAWTEIITPDAWTIEACRWLDLELEKPLDVAGVAAEMRMSSEAFRKRFRQETGAPPGRYRAQRRMEAACALLQRTTLPHREIAERLGFSDEFSFSKRFRKMEGISPRQFRRETTGSGKNHAE